MHLSLNNQILLNIFSCMIIAVFTFLSSYLAWCHIFSFDVFILGLVMILWFVSVSRRANEK